MFEGYFVDYTQMHPMGRVYPKMPQTTSGVYDASKTYVRYALRDSDYPTLIIVDPIYDNSGNTIYPGYYELALSDSHEFLLLMQSKEAVAVIPVFKVEEDAKEPERLNNKEYKKQLKKEKKEREEVNKKRAEAGMPPDEEKVYMEASIEYNPDGDYYLIKYERDTIRAWGAIKK
ncbi:hypothetical protein IKP85_04305 [bacterium]|nr:hypothetical protein [bacterium]